MEIRGIEVLAHVSLLNEIGSDRLRIMVGSRPNIYYRESHWPSEVKWCERELTAGLSGRIILHILGEKLVSKQMRPGDIFELRDGPLKKIGTARAVSIQVWR